MAEANRNKQNHGQGLEPDMPRLLSGQLCLDFVNTVDNHWEPTTTDALGGPQALARWGHHVGLYSDEQRDALLRWVSQHPVEAQRLFSSATALRAAVDRVFRAIAHHQKPEGSDLQIIQQCYLEALSHAQLTQHPKAYQWVIRSDDLQALIWHVADSAVRLLTGGPLDRVRECPGCGDCGGLFLDATKSGTRQWCSMEGCGSRAKMRRLYRRQHQPDAGT